MSRALPARLTFLLLTVAFLGASPARAEERGRKYALLIGCQNYYNRKELNPLRFAHNDVRGFADALRQSGFPEENIFLMLDSKEGVEPQMWPEARKIRDKYVAYLTRMFELGEQDDPAAAAATSLRCPRCTAFRSSADRTT